MMVPNFVIILLLLLIPFIALPLIITLIYKHFYSDHASRILNGENAANGKPLKRWIAPLSLFIILCCVEVLLVILMGVLGSMRASDADPYEEYALEDVCRTYDTDRVNGMILENFAGGDAEGYTLSEKTEGDFSYSLYTSDSQDMLPAYVLRIEYTGDLEFRSWDDSITIGDESTGTMESADAGEPFVKYVVFSDQVAVNSELKSEDISYTLNLYTEEMEDYDTGELGTYDMPEPADSITIDIR